jgi:hypothetical protein
VAGEGGHNQYTHSYPHWSTSWAHDYLTARSHGSGAAWGLSCVHASTRNNDVTAVAAVWRQHTLPPFSLATYSPSHCLARHPLISLVPTSPRHQQVRPKAGAGRVGHTASVVPATHLTPVLRLCCTCLYFDPLYFNFPAGTPAAGAG